MFRWCVSVLSGVLLAAPDSIDADKAMDAFRATVVSLKGFEAEVRVETAILADTKREGKAIVATPRKGATEYVEVGRFRYREQGDDFYLKVLSLSEDRRGRRANVNGRIVMGDRHPAPGKEYFGSITELGGSVRRNFSWFRSPMSLILPDRAAVRARAGYTRVEMNRALPWKLIASPSLVDLDGCSTIRLEFHYGLWSKLNDTDADSEARFEERWFHSAAWLDPRAGHLPRRVHVYDPQSGKVMQQCEVTQFAALPSGQYFPLKGVLTDYAVSQTGKVIVYQKHHLTVNPDSLRVGLTFDETTFEVVGERAKRDSGPVATQVKP